MFITISKGGSLTYPQCLRNPNDIVFKYLYEDERDKFPCDLYSTTEWLAFLSQFGLILSPEPDDFLLLAKKISKMDKIEAIVVSQTVLMPAFYQFINYESTLKHRISKLKEFIANIIVIPAFAAETYNSKVIKKLSYLIFLQMALVAFNYISLPKYKELIWSIQPIFPSDCVPPHQLWKLLKVKPPQVPNVLKHFEKMLDKVWILILVFTIKRVYSCLTDLILTLFKIP